MMKAVFALGRHEAFAGIKKAEDFLLGELRLAVKKFDRR